jgi:dephospho-CoA kinase
LSRVRDDLESLAAEGFRGLVVLEAALLVEWDLGSWCDEVVVVTAPIAERRRRAQAALGLPEAEIDARLARQLPEEERVRYADRVLANDGSMETLTERAAALAGSLREAQTKREGGR